MPDPLKLKLAKELKVPPHMLGLSSPTPGAAGFHGSFAEDAEPYVPGPDVMTLGPHQAAFIAKTNALECYSRPILAGAILVMNINDIMPSAIPPGTVVVAQLFDREEILKSHGTIIRQFLPPDKLVSNAKSDNQIIVLDDPTQPYIAVIRGTLMMIIDHVAQRADRLDNGFSV